MIDYDGKRFRPVGHGGGTVATYRQRGDLLWGDFSGGEIRRGSLTGLCRPDDSIEFAYTMVLADGSVLAGHCVSTPEVLGDGRVLLNERWERFGKHADSGTSQIEEVSEVTAGGT